MANVAELLSLRDFWLSYCNEGDYSLDESLIQQYATPDEDGGVIFRLPCPAPHAIELEVQFEFHAVDVTLVNVQSGKRCELGWWDEARWHPFWLRWLELEKLHRYWQEYPDLLPCSPVATLPLLAPFVGTGVDETNALPARREDVAAAYRELGLFSAGEIGRLVECALRGPPEDDYRWMHHETLGWVFGGEYACYSLRNAEHSDGREGTFPFAEFASLMHQLDGMM